METNERPWRPSPRLCLAFLFDFGLSPEQTRTAAVFGCCHDWRAGGGGIFRQETSQAQTIEQHRPGSPARLRSFGAAGVMWLAASTNALDLRDVPDAEFDMANSLEEWIDNFCETDPLPVDLFDDGDEVIFGPPLSTEEIQAARVRLSRWQYAEAFHADTEALRKRCAPPDYFLQSRLKFLHDARVLAKFARLQSVDQVRLADHNENWPDGRVVIQHRQFNIEVTSTHGGCKLGDEYRHPKGWRFDPWENWEARANAIPKYLDDAIGDKSKKNYSSPCWLVVYLNINEYGIRQIETEQVIAATKARYAATFVNITVIWKGKLY